MKIFYSESEHTKTETTVVQNEDGSQVTQTRTETTSVSESGTGFSISQTSETTVVQETKQAAEGLTWFEVPRHLCAFIFVYLHALVLG